MGLRRLQVVALLFPPNLSCFWHCCRGSRLQLSVNVNAPGGAGAGAGAGAGPIDYGQLAFRALVRSGDLVLTIDLENGISTSSFQQLR